MRNCSRFRPAVLGLTLLALLTAAAGYTTTAQETTATSDPPALETALLPSSDSPLVAVRLLFRAGSIHDPRGKEGLASLTGLMVGNAGTEKRSYAELVDALYPMAASINVQTDREVTVVSGEIHEERLGPFTGLLLEALLAPGFEASDFERNKQQLMSYLTATLRSGSDELLGLEAIQQELFRGHPYEHSPAGTVEGLEKITLEDVKAFYTKRFTQAGLMLGLAGGYPQGYVETLRQALKALPYGDNGDRLMLPEAPKTLGRHFTLIEKETDSVGIHLGFPLPLTRQDPDYFALMVANSFLGEHRTFHGRLMQQLRGFRGLNYGDYSYIEYQWNPPGTTTPTPNVPRLKQYFSVWIRPVVPHTAHFALRAALHEVDRLIETGLTQEEFDLTREFLINYSKLWAQSLPRRLGFAMDSRYYGTPDFIQEIENRLEKLTRAEVNQAAKKYLQTDRYRAVFITSDAAETKARLERDEPSPMTYGSKVPTEVTQVDKVIEKRKVAPTAVTIVPAQTMFQGKGD